MLSQNGHDFANTRLVQRCTTAGLVGPVLIYYFINKAATPLAPKYTLSLTEVANLVMVISGLLSDR